MTNAPLMKRAEDRERRIGMYFSLIDAYFAKEQMNERFVRPSVSLKTLYSDFVVREMSPLYNNGIPLTLESLQMEEKENGTTATLKRQREGGDVENKHDNNENNNYNNNNKNGLTEGKDHLTTEVDSQQEELLTRVQVKFTSLISSEDMTLLLCALRSGAEKVRFVSPLTKQQRTEIHAAVKELLGTTHLSRTEDGAFVIEKSTSATRREAMRRSNPIRTQNFLHFTLYKENIDSNRALRAVATFLGIPVRQINFSGTKDKRAVTLQRVAVRGLLKEKLLKINSCYFGPDSKVKVCGFKELDIGLRLGDTLGNHFQIALRFLPGSPSISPDILQTIQNVIRHTGVVNYYGPQRFGTTEVLTSEVGVHMLAGDFEEALRLIFRSKAIVTPDLIEVQKAVERRSFDEALKLLPRYCFQERDILRHLVRYPNDFLGAFQTIPRTLGMLYCHAVQSLIWNIMASERLALGTEPIVGDLVLKTRYTFLWKREKKLNGDENNIHNINDNNGSNHHEYDDNGTQINNNNNNNNNNVNNESFSKEEGLPEVVCLTAEDIAAGIFHLSDVLLTVPGPDENLQYPCVPGCTRDEYVIRLTSYKGEGLMRAENHLVKMFHYHGAYRSLVVRPTKLEMHLVSTHGPRDPIIPTDFEVLTDNASKVETCTDIVQDSSTVEPTHHAIVVQFSLPPGSYATCVLREFTVCCSEGYHSVFNLESDTSDLPEEVMDVEE